MYDFGVVVNVVDWVVVMYVGQVVELGMVDEIFYDLCYLYIWGLFVLMLSLDSIDQEKLMVILGMLFDLMNFLKGDVFVFCSLYVMKIDFEQELLMYKVFDMYFVKLWFLYFDVFKVELFEVVKVKICQLLNMYQQFVLMKEGEKND